MEILPNLMAVGFTEYESRVYLALLGDYPATGYQISKNAGIPRSMVYEALGRLHARGAVLKSEEQRATLYRPLPPGTLLDRFEQEHTQLVRSLRDNLDKVYSAQEEHRLWTISGRSAVIAYAVQLIHNAGHELSLVMNDADLELLHPAVQSCCQRGVRTNALLTGDNPMVIENQDDQAGEPCPLQIARHPPLESELQELTQLLLVTCDGKECLIASSQDETGEMSATVTNHPDLVLIASQFVWMELFTQRVYARIGDDLLSRLDPQDRRIFESYPKGQPPA